MSAVKARLAKLKGEPASPEVATAGVEGMSADQQRMVRGMVERLATRLAKSGGGAEEWARLIRAYSVLHETDKAKETLAAARTVPPICPPGSRAASTSVRSRPAKSVIRPSSYGWESRFCPVS